MMGEERAKGKGSRPSGRSHNADPPLTYTPFSSTCAGIWFQGLAPRASTYGQQGLLGVFAALQLVWTRLPLLLILQQHALQTILHSKPSRALPAVCLVVPHAANRLSVGPPTLERT